MKRKKIINMTRNQKIALKTILNKAPADAKYKVYRQGTTLIFLEIIYSGGMKKFKWYPESTIWIPIGGSITVMGVNT